MNSGKKKPRTNEDPMFKIDPETGKLTLLPLKMPSTTNSASAKPSEKKSKRISIAPLKMTAADLEDEPSRPSKIRKIDSNSVRKELFNLPNKRSQISRPSIHKRQSISRRSTAAKKAPPKKPNPCELSPLLDMEEVEEELINKKGCLEGYAFKTPSKPVMNFSVNAKNSPFSRKVNLTRKNTPKIVTPLKTPDSRSSNDNEFLELEKMCRTNDTENEKENKCDESPISSVCNLLEGTKLNSIKKQNRASNYTITRLENILEQNRMAVEQFKISHEKNLRKITEILELDKEEYNNLIAVQEESTSKVTEILTELKNSNISHQTETHNKSPLPNRRSKRLFHKSPVQNKDAKLIVSPVMKREDLRKSTLTKNLVTKSQQYQIQSPRLQKALNMYNSMRSELSVLTTPRLDRKSLIESPKTTSLSRSLSRRIQDQCHLLQDTPLPK